MKYYTGIGSRKIPEEYKYWIRQIVDYIDTFKKDVFILRSGGADGADSMFEEAATYKEIYLPWKGFNNNSSALYDITPEAYVMAEQFHPAWERLSHGGQKLIARDVYQVLGKNLTTPSEFIICWTEGGKEVGGTAQAMRIAKAYKIPIYNLANYEKYEDFFNDIKNQINAEK